MATAVQKLNGAAHRSEIVKMRLAGVTLEEIAAKLGISESGVRYHQRAWVESIAPPAERAHEMRETWINRLEVAHAKTWPLVQEGDPKAIETMLKIQAQAARLFGLELQPNVQVNVVTAEGMAALFGLDAGTQPAIEGSATEITDGS